jgi:hypothetical protein
MDDKNPFSFVSIIMDQYEWAVYLAILIVTYWIGIIIYNALSETNIAETNETEQ